MTDLRRSAEWAQATTIPTSRGSSPSASDEQNEENGTRIPISPEKKFSQNRERNIEPLSNIKAYGRDSATELGEDGDVEVAEWLDGLRLGKYKSNFKQEDITMDVLVMLTEEHLISALGVDKLGERLKIMGSIHAMQKMRNNRDEMERIKLKEEVANLKGEVDRLVVEIGHVSRRLDDISDML